MFNCWLCLVIRIHGWPMHSNHFSPTLLNVFPNVMSSKHNVFKMQCPSKLSVFLNAMSLLTEKLPFNILFIGRAFRNVDVHASEKCIPTVGWCKSSRCTMCLWHSLRASSTISCCACAFCFHRSFFFASENLFHRNKSSAFLLFAIVSCVCVRRLFKRAGNLLAFLYFSVVFSSKWASAHDHFYIFIAYMRQGTWLFAHAICIRSGLLGPLFGEQCKNGFLKVTNNARERNERIFHLLSVFCTHRDLSLCVWRDIICLVSRIHSDKYRSSAVANYAVRKCLIQRKCEWNGHEPGGKNKIMQCRYWRCGSRRMGRNWFLKKFISNFQCAGF